METVSAVRLSDLLQPQLLRLLFCPTQHGSLPIEEEESRTAHRAAPVLPSSPWVDLNLGKCFGLGNMSGRSRSPHSRSAVNLVARLLTPAMRAGPRLLHRLSRSHTRSNARRQSCEQNRCNGDRRVRSKPA